jgi:hypothetical protein
VWFSYDADDCDGKKTLGGGRTMLEGNKTTPNDKQTTIDDVWKKTIPSISTSENFGPWGGVSSGNQTWLVMEVDWLPEELLYLRLEDLQQRIRIAYIGRMMAFCNFIAFH